MKTDAKLVEGPAVEELTRHLAECPETFLAEPLQENNSGDVHVAAVVSDLLKMMGGKALTQEELQDFTYSGSPVVKERNRLRLILIACWLCSHPRLLQRSEPSAVLHWLRKGQNSLAKLVSAESFVHDAERREEFARLGLEANRMLPLGEGKEEAGNRLDSLSSVKRDEVVRASQAAQERARKLREELAEQERARVAASTYNHE